MPMQLGGAPTTWERHEELKKLSFSTGDTVKCLAHPTKCFRVEAAGMKILHLVNVDNEREKISAYKKDCIKG